MPALAAQALTYLATLSFSIRRGLQTTLDKAALLAWLSCGGLQPMLKLSVAPLRKPMSRLPELTMLIPRSSFHGKDAARKGPGAVLERRGPAQQRLCSMVKARAWLQQRLPTSKSSAPTQHSKAKSPRTTTMAVSSRVATIAAPTMPTEAPLQAIALRWVPSQATWH